MLFQGWYTDLVVIPRGSNALVREIEDSSMDQQITQIGIIGHADGWARSTDVRGQGEKAESGAGRKGFVVALLLSVLLVSFHLSPLLQTDYCTLRECSDLGPRKPDRDDLTAM